MVRRKTTQTKGPVLNIFDLKNDHFRILKINLSKLKKEIDNVEIKIQNDGIEGYYSIDSDILNYAQQAYISMKVLSYIKNFKGENNE